MDFVLFVCLGLTLLMSLAVGSASNSKNMGFDENHEDGDSILDKHGSENEAEKGISRQMSETSLCATEDETDDEGSKIELGPQRTLKEELEKDKVTLFLALVLTFKFFVQFVSCNQISLCLFVSFYEFCLYSFVVWKFRMMRV